MNVASEEREVSQTLAFLTQKMEYLLITKQSGNKEEHVWGEKVFFFYFSH